MTPATFKAIRERSGYTQAGLAGFLRVTPRMVQMIEAGDRNPGGPLIVLMELLDAGRIHAVAHRAV